MPYDEMGIGPTPCDEKCAQVGEENYHERAREESRRFIELIRKKLGPEPPGARLTITSNPHDFGTYLDVVCRFQEGDEEALAYALLCESEAPRTWQERQWWPGAVSGPPPWWSRPLRRTRPGGSPRPAPSLAPALWPGSPPCGGSPPLPPG